MAYTAVFITVAVIELFSAILIFRFKDVLHSVLALSAFFILNSVLFFMMQQPLLALLQLFIMVGGISTYIFVGVASVSYSHFKHTSYPSFVLLSIASILLFVYKISDVQLISSQQNLLTGNLIGSALFSNVSLLYVIAFMLFSIALGSIILLKNLGAKK